MGINFGIVAGSSAGDLTQAIEDGRIVLRQRYEDGAGNHFQTLELANGTVIAYAEDGSGEVDVSAGIPADWVVDPDRVIDADAIVRILANEQDKADKTELHNELTLSADAIAAGLSLTDQELDFQPATGIDAADPYDPATDYTGDDSVIFEITVPDTGGPYVFANGEVAENGSKRIARYDADRLAADSPAAIADDAATIAEFLLMSPSFETPVDNSEIFDFINRWTPNAADLTVENVVSRSGYNAARITDASAGFRSHRFVGNDTIDGDKTVRIRLQKNESQATMMVLRSLGGGNADLLIDTDTGVARGTTNTSKPAPEIVSTYVDDEIIEVVAKFSQFADSNAWDFFAAVGASGQNGYVGSITGYVDLIGLDLNYVAGNSTATLVSGATGYYRIGEHKPATPHNITGADTNITTGFDFTSNPSMTWTVNLSDVGARSWAQIEINVDHMLERFNAGDTVDQYIHTHDNDFIIINVIDPVAGIIAIRFNGRDQDYNGSELWITAPNANPLFLIRDDVALITTGTFVDYSITDSRITGAEGDIAYFEYGDFNRDSFVFLPNKDGELIGRSERRGFSTNDTEVRVVNNTLQVKSTSTGNSGITKIWYKQHINAGVVNSGTSQGESSRVLVGEFQEAVTANTFDTADSVHPLLLNGRTWNDLAADTDFEEYELQVEASDNGSNWYSLGTFKSNRANGFANDQRLAYVVAGTAWGLGIRIPDVTTGNIDLDGHANWNGGRFRLYGIKPQITINTPIIEPVILNTDDFIVTALTDAPAFEVGNWADNNNRQRFMSDSFKITANSADVEPLEIITVPEGTTETFYLIGRQHIGVANSPNTSTNGMRLNITNTGGVLSAVVPLPVNHSIITGGYLDASYDDLTTEISVLASNITQTQIDYLFTLANDADVQNFRLSAIEEALEGGVFEFTDPATLVHGTTRGGYIVGPFRAEGLTDIKLSASSIASGTGAFSIVTSAPSAVNYPIVSSSANELNTAVANSVMSVAVVDRLTPTLLEKTYEFDFVADTNYWIILFAGGSSNVTGLGIRIDGVGLIDVSSIGTDYSAIPEFAKMIDAQIALPAFAPFIKADDRTLRVRADTGGLIAIPTLPVNAGQMTSGFFDDRFAEWQYNVQAGNSPVGEGTYQIALNNVAYPTIANITVSINGNDTGANVQIITDDHGDGTFTHLLYSLPAIAAFQTANVRADGVTPAGDQSGLVLHVE